MSKQFDNHSKTYSRRHVLDIIAAGGLGAVMGGMPFRSANAISNDVVKIGYLPITDAAPLLVAHSLGYFEEEGLKVAKPQRIKSWSTMIKGFAGGHLNLVHLLKPISIWLRYNNNFPVKLMAWAHQNGSAIMVGKDTGIESFEGLAGKRMAIPYWYSMHNIVLQAGLRQAGIKPVVDNGQQIPADACGLKVVSPPQMVSSLKVKDIDGYTVAEPFNAVGELSAGARVLRFTGDVWKGHPCCVVCMHENDTLNKPAWTQKIMNAIVRAEIYAANNKQEVARMLSKDGKGYFSTSAKVVERAMTYYNENFYTSPQAIKHGSNWGGDRIEFTPYPYPSATRLIVEMMNKTLVDSDSAFLKKVSPDFVAKDLVNYDFVSKALKSNPEWVKLPGVNAKNPFERSEEISV